MACLKFQRQVNGGEEGRGGEGGREGGRLGQLLLGGLGTYALLASVTVQYITGFIITVSVNSYRPYLRNLV